MAYYIAPDNTVHEFRVASPSAILLDEKTVLQHANPHRMFAVHPDENENLELVDGVWHYQGEPIKGD